MKTVIILYLPGHAGNFIARLFSLGHDTMPLLEKSLLQSYLATAQEIPNDFDRLENYRFSNITERFDDWQHFHRSFADYKECTKYRLLNTFHRQKYSRIVFPLHPYEFSNDHVSQYDSEFYFVDLDQSRHGSWVNEQQKKLNFQYRSDEHQQFNNLKQLNSMRSISLDQLLASVESFQTEYHRVCELMNISADTEQALQLRQDWMSVRG